MKPLSIFLFFFTQNVTKIRYLELGDSKLSVLADDLCLKLSEEYFRLLGAACGSEEIIPVSYTHLTLPTIYSV